VVLILAVSSLITSTTPSLTSSGLVSAQAAAPNWSYTGSLKTARLGHTTTLLPNGKVLVVGGCNDAGCPGLDSAELYDPITGTWRLTGAPNFDRVEHSATLLPNGKVLVAGGWNDGVIGSAELYDPVAGTWSFTGNLNVARADHTATLLPNGKVLVAGGGNNGSPLQSTELYDPATGTWSITGDLNLARLWGHTQTLLPNGKVLVTGGTQGDFSFQNLSSSELYDPNTGTWSITGSLNVARFDLTATLLPNGNLLVTGGESQDGSINNSAELYNPTTETWSYTGSLSTGRYGHTATLLPDGKVLVAGGHDWNTNTYLDSADVYDPAAGNWSVTAKLNVMRLRHTAVLLQSGKVLVVGGFNRASRLLSAELFDSGSSSTINPIDDPQFFVCQHYRDFLNREPDADGLTFWTNQISSCGGDSRCNEINRITVSAAYFLSIEFQETGYLVYRLYKTAYGDLPGSPIPIKFNEFTPDTQTIGRNVIVKQAGWEQMLANNKQAFISDFVQRSRFTLTFPPSMSAAEFVDKLNRNAGEPLSPTERDQLASDLASGRRSRAEVLQAVAENQTLAQQEFNRAFVLMQYFGYLRRNPNDAPDANFDGYNFWLNKLDSFHGNYLDAEMVKAFLSADEYRNRFGP
jgi:N-acetylneuraminic acid mutarotase